MRKTESSEIIITTLMLEIKSDRPSVTDVKMLSLYCFRFDFLFVVNIRGSLNKVLEKFVML